MYYFIFLETSSLANGIFKSALVSFQLFGDIFPFLIYSLIPLRARNKFYIISIFKNLLFLFSDPEHGIVTGCRVCIP